MSPRSRSVAKWSGITLGALVAVVLLVLAFLDWNLLKHPIERIASAHSGRQIAIAGNLGVHLWSSHPRFSIEGLTVGNPPWEANRPMMQIQRVQVTWKWLPLLKGQLILPRVEIIQPVVYLHREKSGRANWTFESTKPSAAPAGAPTRLPVVRDFVVDDGKLTLADEMLRLKADGSIYAHEHGSQADPRAFRIEAKGTLNDEPFLLRVLGGPLLNLDPDRPYPFDAQIAAGTIRVAADGFVRKPFDLGKLSLNIKGSGQDLADLYYLTQLALPNTPPFTLEVSLDRDDQKIHVTKLAGTVGASDLHGQLEIDASRKRPRISGDLVSKQLRLVDLAASLGGKSQDKSLAGDATQPAGTGQGKGSPHKQKMAAVKAPSNVPPPPADHLFPDAHLQVNRVRAMDGDVRFRADSIEAGSFPLKQVLLHVRLDDGVLSLDPFEFTMPQGKLHGTTRIDARGKIPHTQLDLRVQDVQLAQLKGKAPGAQPPLGGVLEARAVFEGRGDSVHDFLGDANGKVIVVVPHGDVRAAFAELTGINIARGLGLLVKGDNEQTQIRCGLAHFAVDNGTMRAQTLVIDTQDVRITGHGEVRLGPEELDVTIKGEPKKVRLARLRTPIDVRGHLMKPSIGIDAGKTLKQGAVAAALGAVLTPFAAIVAFIDPGLAKDENCSALLQAAPTVSSSGPRVLNSALPLSAAPEKVLGGGDTSRSGIEAGDQRQTNAPPR